MRIQFDEHIQGRSTDGLDMSDSSDCRLRLRAGSRSFHAASLLLPPSVRGHATALYAFCRVADDAVDCAREAGAVAALERRLSRMYAGCPDDIPADRAFAQTAARFAIPKAVPEALLEGFAWDAANRRYEDLSDVIAYAARVAGSVGIMMAMVMGVTSQAALARACDLGVAMQLSNIARDVGEDARAGRLYLPRQWFREAGMDPDRWLADPVFDPAIAHMVARLLTTAEALYSRADLGIRALPSACRPGIRAARLIYAEIGAEVIRGGYDSISRRAVVSSSRKIGLVLKAMLTAFTSARWEELAPLPETRFLVEAIPAYGAQHQRTGKFGWWNLAARIDRFFELLMRLENAEHAARGRS